MNPHDNSWQKLVGSARRAPSPDASAPYGFATRVAALAFRGRLASPPVFERFALRGLLAAAVLGLAAMAFGYSTLVNDTDDEVVVGDAVGEMLAMATP
jgi:hypothetical protein